MKGARKFYFVEFLFHIESSNLCSKLLNVEASSFRYDIDHIPMLHVLREIAQTIAPRS